jgi:hypothetical protein
MKGGNKQCNKDGKGKSKRRNYERMKRCEISITLNKQMEIKLRK